jgi:hypothetical protein
MCEKRSHSTLFPWLQLYVEVMGRRSNAILVSQVDGTVLACGYQVRVVIR